MSYKIPERYDRPRSCSRGDATIVGWILRNGLRGMLVVSSSISLPADFATPPGGLSPRPLEIARKVVAMERQANDVARRPTEIPGAVFVARRCGLHKREGESIAQWEPKFVMFVNSTRTRKHPRPFMPVLQNRSLLPERQATLIVLEGDHEKVVRATQLPLAPGDEHDFTHVQELAVPGEDYFVRSQGSHVATTAIDRVLFTNPVALDVTTYLAHARSTE